jgi:transcriptional regulator with XRE-family HTH domain
MEGFGARIKRTRTDELHLTQEEFARKLGFTTGAWASDVENGLNGIDVSVLYDICKLAKYPADYFLDPSWEAHRQDVPQTRLDWERMFRGEPSRAAAHWELDSLFRKNDDRK